MFNRRAWMLAAAAATAGHWSRDALALPPKQLQFPRDFGSHLDLRTEWWYITGHATSDNGRVFGFQVTFFRSRVEATQAMRSHFAAKQLVFAHTALTDLEGRSLLHDQRMARSSGAEPGQNPLDTAAASTADTKVTLQDWSLTRVESDLQARVQGADFSLTLRLVATQAVLLQGTQGLSQKGLATAVGDEGGFAPNLASTRAALDFIMASVEQAGFKAGSEVKLALDCAATEFFKNGKYEISGEGLSLSPVQMADYLAALANDYPIVSIEDGMGEDDFEGWKALTDQIGHKVQLVGDDLFVTNPKRLAMGIEQGLANSLLVKVNQIGSLSETLEAVSMAQIGRAHV